MPRADLDQQFYRIEQLVVEIQKFVPADVVGVSEFRADMAGLLVVSMASSYENCVKETLVAYASSCHSSFGNFALNNYKKLNSRISISDLHSYARTFDSQVGDRFKQILDKRKRSIDLRIGRNIESSYKQILSWRHDFAHAGIRNTTIEEAVITHRLAKRVLYAFDDAFNGD